MALARQLLAMPAANPQAHEDAQAFMRRVAAIDITCCCTGGHWRLLQRLLPERAAMAAAGPGAGTHATTCRGPP